MATVTSSVPDAATGPDLAAQEKDPKDVANFWNNQLDIAEKDHREFIDNGKLVLRRYKRGQDDDKRSGGRANKRLNILYSNVELLLAALYGKMATPDVRRRYVQSDPLAEQVAEVVEGALVYCNEVYGDKPVEEALKDYLLPGRGTVRIEYEPILTATDDGKQHITGQVLRESYVHWRDFRCMPARTWADIEKNGWIAFRHRMSRTELCSNFGDELGKKAPLNWTPDITDRKNLPDAMKKAEVWEVWDITDRKRTWIIPGFDQPMRTDDDPYGLEAFFPMPEPITYYTTTDSVIPEPEFFVYRDQADDLDEIVNRISRLTKALKRRGVYDQSVKELSRLASAGDNQFIPVENYQSLATKGGLQAAFQTEDISVVAQVLLELYKQRDMLVQSIWEMVGIADIMRGSSDPNEKLGSQQMKAQFGSQRMLRRQRSIQRWIRDLMRIKAEIIAEHFEPDVLSQMTGQPITPEVMQILRTDKLRSYRIDIETDSTLFEDTQEIQAARGKMITALTTFIEGWGPIAAQQPVLLPLSFELLKFGMGGFKAIRPIEDAIDQAQAVMVERAQQAQFQPAPSAEQIKSQTELQARQQDMQIAQTESQGKMQIEQAKAQASAQLAQQRHEHELTIAQQTHQQDVTLAQQKAAHEAALSQQKLDFEHRARETDDNHRRDIEMISLQHKHAMEANDSGASLADAVGKIDPAPIGQAIVEAVTPLIQIQVQTNQQLIQALMALVQTMNAPRKRIPIRDENGRITEAHDMPMTVQ